MFFSVRITVELARIFETYMIQRQLNAIDIFQLAKCNTFLCMYTAIWE